MSKANISWDAANEASNVQVFGIDFTEAASVFGDKNAVYFTRAAQNHIVGRSYRDAIITVIYAAPAHRVVIIEVAYHAEPRDRAHLRR